MSQFSFRIGQKFAHHWEEWEIRDGRLFASWEVAANDFRAVERGVAPAEPTGDDPGEMDYEEFNSLVDGKVFDCGKITNVWFRVEGKELMKITFATDAFAASRRFRVACNSPSSFTYTGSFSLKNFANSS